MKLCFKVSLPAISLSRHPTRGAYYIVGRPLKLIAVFPITTNIVVVDRKPSLVKIRSEGRFAIFILSKSMHVFNELCFKVF